MKRLFVLIWMCCLVLGGAGKALADHHDHDLGAGLKVGLLTGLGGPEDESFNAMQVNGLTLAARRFGIAFEVKAPNSVKEDLPLLRELVHSRCRVIFAGGGYHNQEPVRTIAGQYPDIRFILLDDFALEYPPNVASVTFHQNEGSFLAGALAALMSRAKTIGFLGAADIQVINDFRVGYSAGAGYVRPGVGVVENYVGRVDGPFSPFNSPLRSRRLALEMYQKGADVIFAVAANSNRGVFAAAKEMGFYAIGVDSDQDHMARGHVLTSMMKRLDTAVYLMIERVLKGEFENRNYSLGLAEGGVSLSPMTFTRAVIPPKVLETLARLREEIIQGRIDVPSTMGH